jgi:hypothetical protein
VGTSAQWATNGQVLLCFSVKNRLLCFDLATGRKISKVAFWTAGDSFSDSASNALIYFNYLNGQFVRLLTADHSSESNKYWVFNYSNFKLERQEDTSTKAITGIRSALYKQACHSEEPECVRSLNVIKNLMKKRKQAPQDASTQPREQAVPLVVQRCMILD